MPRISLLAELPGALPDRGVLVLQTGAGRSGPSDKIRSEFLKHLTLIYANRQAELAHEAYYDRPWQIRTQDNGLLLRVGNALQSIRDSGRRGAVVVRIIVQGPDNSVWRHREVEQHLVELLTVSDSGVRPDQSPGHVISAAGGWRAVDRAGMVRSDAVFRRL